MQKSVNSFNKGLNISLDNINQPKDTYSYALNSSKEDPVNNPEIISNEKGFTSYLDLGYEYTLLGSSYLGEENYTLFIKSPIGSDSPFNRIILLQNETSSTIYDNINLNFSELNSIKATYRYNYKNERVVYFVDGLNDDRLINVDNLSIYINNVDELSLDIKYTPAILTNKQVNDSGGVLLTGTYEFFGSYKTKDNAVSSWFILTANPVYIIDDDINSLSANANIIVDGCVSGIPTNKSITLNIENLDSRFNNLRIGVIKTVGNTSESIYIDNIYYSTSNISYNYTGLSTEVIIPNSTELLLDKVKYYGSNAIIQMNNRLLRANMSSNKIDIGYQTYANNIVVDYYIQEELVGTMNNTTDYTLRSDWWKSANTIYSDKNSLMRDEIYSIGIAFGLKKEGIESEVYHIPGRAINSIPMNTYKNQYSDSATLPYSTTWDTNIITENGDTIPTWKVVNTAANSVDNFVKKLAYWESTEMYPANLNLPIVGSSTNGENNTPIRHHKMPSAGLEPIFKTIEVDSVINFYKRHLGLNFSNIQVPDSIKNNISYIRIYITPRITDENKSIIAKGIFTNCSLSKINIGNFDTVTDVEYIKPCTPFNDQNELFNGGCYKDGQDDGWTTDNFYHSFYSPDTTLRNPQVNTNRVYIENEFTGIAQYYNTAASHINVDPFLSGGNSGTNSSTNGGYKRDFFYDDSNSGRTLPTGQTSSHAVINVTPGVFRSTYKAIAILNSSNQVSNSLSRRKTKKVIYVPFNANLTIDQLGGMDNPYNSQYGSSTVLLELNPDYTNLGNTETTDTSFEFTDNDNSHNISDPSQGSDKSGTFHEHTIESPVVVYRYGSIKRDNTSQYGSIEAIEYNPTDLVIANPTFNDSNILIESCQGLIGDSWIDMFSVKRCKYTQKEHYTFGGEPEIAIGISTFFTESNINHRLRYAEGITFQQYYPKQVLSQNIKQYLDVNSNSYIFFNDNYYEENVDFNKQVSKKNFGLSQLDAQTFGITNYSTRILYSDQLLDESSIDSYRVFLANNYRDLPKDKGFICHLFKKGPELYCVTRDALWRVFTANETFKATTENVSVGTGDFLSLEPVEMLSIEGGHGGSSSKSSLVECSYGYFYIDKNKGKLILFKDRQSYYDNSQQVDISLIGVFNYIRNNFKLTNPEITTFDIPLLNSGYIAGYDPELKRILVTKNDYSLTTAQQGVYRGLFDPTVEYNAGDIYLKEDGSYYTYESRSSDYVTVSSSSDLSDFVLGNVDPITYSFTTPSNGTVITYAPDRIRYTPNTSYLGSDSFDLSMGCTTETIDITVVAGSPSSLVETLSLINGNGSLNVSANFFIDGFYQLGGITIPADNGSSPVPETINYTATNNSTLKMQIYSGHAPTLAQINYRLGTYGGVITGTLPIVNVTFSNIDMSVSDTYIITIN